MKLILDTNILFSGMNNSSIAWRLLSWEEIEFFAPDFILKEILEHKEECQEKFNLTEYDFKVKMEWISQNIKLYPLESFKAEIEEALALVKDLDDAPFLALALHLKIPVWSNDNHFKQQEKVIVYNTAELIDLMLKFL